jgi:amino acid adenylation domain-containing protein
MQQTRTSGNGAQPQRIHARFEAQAAHAPDAPAITCQGQTLTYDALNARANRIAHTLRALGAGRGTIVGLWVERSIDMVAGILGIAKAGAAYLPLDPTCPPQRLAFMLGDAAAPVVLTHRERASQLPQLGSRVLLLDDESSLSSDTTNLDDRTTAEDLAYVIYTSGSTGNPKGVPVTHENVSRLFDETDAWFHFGPQDVWTLFHSISFDFSVWELWGALIYGGQLVVVPYLVSRSPGDFYQLLRSERVTVLNQTPSAFRQLIRAEESLGAAADLALRLVIFGGEALEPQSLRPWFDRHGDQKPHLVNMYGITETTVFVTYRPLGLADLTLSSRGSPIGVPIPDLQVHLLDKDLHAVAAGTPGEMYIGGPGVARGYLNRPALTAERYVPSPFDSTPGARLYKSGDLALIGPTGELEFLGRGDDQVKIRGYRIELGEVEAALARHPDVRESAVVAHEETPGEKVLVAYIAARRGQTLEPTALRTWLKETLPDYMVPSTLLILDALPLTTNGKLDRSALPSPKQSVPQPQKAPAATDSEAAIAAVCAGVLGCPVGVEDNFFDLGANSFLVMEMHAELSRAGFTQLSIPDLFAHPNVKALVRHLEGARPALTAAQSRAKQQKAALARQKATGRSRP